MTANTLDACRDRIFPAFDKAARESGRDPKKIEKAILVGEAVVEIEKTIKRIRRIHAGVTITENFNEENPRKIEESGARVSDEDIRKNYLLYEDVAELIDHLYRFVKIGANHLIFTDFSTNHTKTSNIFKRKIIPYFKGR